MSTMIESLIRACTAISQLPTEEKPDLNLGIHLSLDELASLALVPGARRETMVFLEADGARAVDVISGRIGRCEWKGSRWRSATAAERSTVERRGVDVPTANYRSFTVDGGAL